MFDKLIFELQGSEKAKGLCFGTGFAGALLIVGQSLCFAWAVALLWERAGSGSFALGEAAPPIAGFAACYLARQLVLLVRTRAMDGIAQACAANLLEELMGAVYEGGPAHVQRHGSGTITAAAVEGIDRVKTYIGLSVPKVADLMVVPVVLAVALLALDWVSGVISIVALPCIIFFMHLLGLNSREAASAQHGEYERLTNHFTDVLRGFPTIKLFGRSSAFDERVYERSEKLREATVKTLRTVTLSSLVLDLFRTFTLAAVAIMLGFRLMDGSVALFPALAVLMMVPEYFAAIRRYSADYHATLEGKNQLGAIMAMCREGAAVRGADAGAEVVDTQADADVAVRDAGADAQNAGAAVRDAGAEVDACDADADADAGDSGGRRVASERRGVGAAEPAAAFQARHVSYTYRTGDEERTALRDVSFSVPAACKVGIVGASGAGKSTLVRLLAGFADPDAAPGSASNASSAFSADGVPFATLADPSWRRRTTYIPQNPHLFHATLRENIAFYCPDATAAEVGNAVRMVGLEGTVDALADGLETVVGKGGRQLSGGQAQRVALARTLLDAQRSVWVFDEPTAHLDVETELELKRNMLPLMDGRLVFFATHRLHWMQSMDVLVVLQDGQVAQVGTFAELSEQPGAFADLTRSLRRGYGA